MRRLWILCGTLCAACGGGSAAARIDSTASVAALRDTLVLFGQEDQQGRDSIGLAVARNDTVFLQRIAHADSARTRWLQGQVLIHGWPGRVLVGDQAARAAWLIVQHSADEAFQEQMLPLIERAAATDSVGPADVAMLADRIAIHRGTAQRYGTQFSLKDGTLVADPIADLGALDSLRASVGLPPMLEYVRVLGEMNKLPVEWPPRQ